MSLYYLSYKIASDYLTDQINTDAIMLKKYILLYIVAYKLYGQEANFIL